ncbi:hypothetical protein LTR22_027120 [Elasticomyces elasticus]|nr:hypothetical protein LTR22_027120 [Elasticomyces elasticus]KAK4899022.1 hypothetical protein LTR49_027730 [Elasticomyces elasticus]
MSMLPVGKLEGCRSKHGNITDGEGGSIVAKARETFVVRASVPVPFIQHERPESPAVAKGQRTDQKHVHLPDSNSPYTPQNHEWCTSCNVA